MRTQQGRALLLFRQYDLDHHPGMNLERGGLRKSRVTIQILRACQPGRRSRMAIELNHTIVPTHDKVASAKFFASIFGLPFTQSAVGYFAPVRVNEALTLAF